MLDGFKISGYRSFGSKPAVIPDLQQVNVFIGKNNCGKSNILRFVNIMSPFCSLRRSDESTPQLNPMLDFAAGTTTREITFGLQIKRGGFTDQIFQSIAEPFGPLWEKVCPDTPDSIWLDFNLTGNHKATTASIERIANQILLHCDNNCQQKLTALLCQYQGSNPEKRAEDISKTLHTKAQLMINVHMIDAFRKITDEGGDTLSGAGLIKELRKLQSPQLAQYDAGKARFSTIVNFIRSILGEPNAELEIPAENDEVYVTLNGKVLPLESLGTGIHELIILAAAVTLVDDAIFCIEEPEIHLHSELQKKFIAYIGQNTKNQYLITSHSNAFFDLPGVNIYSCVLRDNMTQCNLVSTAMERHTLLRDLGYRPSDLLQANYVIWVEGPSDRVYLKHWLDTKASDLVEGLHYTIMFYGGRLLAHLAYDSPEVKEFINLAHLNRSACIIFDSDKDKVHGPINRTKRRVKGDFEKNSCFTWVTNGRTIENYVSEQIFNDAVAAVHPKTKKTIKWSRFGDLTHLRKDKLIDKVAVAKAVAEKPPDFTILNLDAVLAALIAEIRKNNPTEFVEQTHPA